MLAIVMNEEVIFESRAKMGLPDFSLLLDILVLDLLLSCYLEHN